MLRAVRASLLALAAAAGTRAARTGMALGWVAVARVTLVLASLAWAAYSPAASAQSGGGAPGQPPLPGLEVIDRHLSGGAAGTAEAGAGRAELGNGQARGVLTPRTEAVLSSEIAARIVELPRRDGETFAEGDVLVSFDCRYFQAQLAGARASLVAAQHRLQNNQALARLHSVGMVDVAISAAEAQRAQAEVGLAQVVVDRCVIRAPFAGRVVETLAHAQESVPAGHELLSILDDSSLEVRLVVPSRWLRWLTPGTRFDFAVDETGRTYAGHVQALGARIDAVSQSVRITGQLDGRPEGLTAGMSGTATFAPPPTN